MVESMLEATKHLAPLIALSNREKGKPGWDICADLWLNALRRGERGRYDNAIFPRLSARVPGNLERREPAGTVCRRYPNRRGSPPSACRKQ